MAITFTPDAEVGPSIDCVKIYMADATLTTSGNTAMRDGIAMHISRRTQPLIVGAPYTSGSGSAILFVVRHATLDQAVLQAAIQTVTGLSAATVTITSTLVG